MGPIVLLTDFGLQDPYVGVMKSVISGIAPRAPVIDLCHGVEPQGVREAAFHLKTSCSYLPKGSVVVVVTDPGVGSGRGIFWGRSARHQFLFPDNGVLGWLGASDGPREFRRLGNMALGLKTVSRTFHGRDLFAPVAARLWLGLKPSRLGPPAAPSVRFPFPEPSKVRGGLRGEVLYLDRFGNAVTNVRADALPRGARASFKGRRLGLGSFYAEIPESRALALAGSSGFVELAVRNGNFASRFGAKPGDKVHIYANHD